MLKKQIRIFMAGMLIIIPIAATIGVMVWFASLLGGMGASLSSLFNISSSDSIHPFLKTHSQWIAVAIVFLTIYLIGLMAKFWIFKKAINLVDRLLSNVPGIKTVYESIRDLLKLFGGDADSMGYTVLYDPPSFDYKMLGIVTNEHPDGLPENDKSVIVYLPLGYMLGGPIVYANPEQLERIDMPVETAMKLAATAFVGGKNHPLLPEKAPHPPTKKTN